MTQTRRPTTVTTPTDEQVQIVREFAAPRELVWRAWTTPELVRRWWHAQRGTMTSCEIDLRPGGRWRYAMQAHGGFEVAFSGEYLEVAPPDRLVTTEVFEGAPGSPARTTATFTERDGVTTVTVLVEHADRAARDRHLEAGMEDGLRDALALIEDVALAGVTVTRRFAAEPEQVFAAWTDPTLFARWFGTRAAAVDRVQLDVRPGGGWRARMLAGEPPAEIAWSGRYVDVDPPRRLVLTLSDGSEPDEFELVHVELAAAPGGGTDMTFRQLGGHLDAAGYARVETGWRAFFDDLAAVLPAPAPAPASG